MASRPIRAPSPEAYPRATSLESDPLFHNLIHVYRTQLEEHSRRYYIWLVEEAAGTSRARMGIPSFEAAIMHVETVLTVLH